MWMWSEQQRPLRLPLLQFLIQSAQVISFSSYSISNHFSPNLYSTLLWMQCNANKRTWKSHRLWNTPHCRSSLIDSTPPCPGPTPTPTFSLLYYITYFRNLIQFFFPQITLTMNLQLRFNYAIFMNWNFNCITTLLICLCLTIYSLFYCLYYLF